MARYSLALLLFLIISASSITAQVLPMEGSVLNYRIIGFTFPAEKQVKNYTIEIANGNYDDATFSKKNIVKTVTCKTNKTIAEVPAFGSAYTWRITYIDKGKAMTSSLHHFSTGTNDRIDTTSRLRIIKRADKFKDAYVFIDATGVLYDMEGKPVWFLPDSAHEKDKKYQIRDMKITSQGTVTFMFADHGIYEINYDGTVLWKGTNTGSLNGETGEHYNHEFTRLHSGHHYMVAGEQNVWRDLPGSGTDNLRNIARTDIVRDSNNKYHLKMQFGTLMEYDEKGEIVWSWKSADYFTNSDFSVDENGISKIIDAHQNSFFFDEQKKAVYISFRNISRILKLKYPEGTLLATYGTKYEPGVTEMGTDLFCEQHSIKETKDGHLLLYNNNSLVLSDLPKIEILKEPASNTGALKEIWEYKCTRADMTASELSVYNKRFGTADNVPQPIRRENGKPLFTSGGNVIELPEQSMFVSLSTPLCELFIVSKEKKTVWRAALEKWDPKTNEWIGEITYRASIIPNHNELEQLIWHSEATSTHLNNY